MGALIDLIVELAYIKSSFKRDFFELAYVAGFTKNPWLRKSVIKKIDKFFVPLTMRQLFRLVDFDEKYKMLIRRVVYNHEWHLVADGTMDKIDMGHMGVFPRERLREHLRDLLRSRGI